MGYIEEFSTIPSMTPAVLNDAAQPGNKKGLQVARILHEMDGQDYSRSMSSRKKIEKLMADVTIQLPLRCGEALLARSIRHNVPSVTKYCLKHNDDVKECIIEGSRKESPVLLALQNTRVPEADVLSIIDKGADLNVTDHDGTTLVMFAALHGRAGVLQRLHTAGAVLDEEITKAGAGSSTCLAYAIAGGYKNCVRYILDQKPDLKRRVSGQSYLMQAVKSGTLSNFQALLDAGMKIDPYETDADGESLYRVAVKRGRHWSSTDGALQIQKIITTEYERCEEEKRVREEADAAAARSGWKLLDENTVCYLTEAKVIDDHYRVMEVFNFRAGVYTRRDKNLASAQETAASLPFSALGNQAYVDEARESLEAMGGKVPEGYAPPSPVKSTPAIRKVS